MELIGSGLNMKYVNIKLEMLFLLNECQSSEKGKKSNFQLIEM